MGGSLAALFAAGSLVARVSLCDNRFRAHDTDGEVVDPQLSPGHIVLTRGRATQSRKDLGGLLGTRTDQGREPTAADLDPGRRVVECGPRQSSEENMR